MGAQPFEGGVAACLSNCLPRCSRWLLLTAKQGQGALKISSVESQHISCAILASQGQCLLTKLETKLPELYYNSMTPKTFKEMKNSIKEENFMQTHPCSEDQDRKKKDPADCTLEIQLIKECKMSIWTETKTYLPMEPLCTPKLRETTRHKPEGMAKNVPYRLPDTINVDGDVSFDEGDILQFLPGRQGQERAKDPNGCDMALPSVQDFNAEYSSPIITKLMAMLTTVKELTVFNEKRHFSTPSQCQVNRQESGYITEVSSHIFVHVIGLLEATAAMLHKGSDIACKLRQLQEQMGSLMGANCSERLVLKVSGSRRTGAGKKLKLREADPRAQLPLAGKQLRIMGNHMSLGAKTVLVTLQLMLLINNQTVYDPGTWDQTEVKICSAKLSKPLKEARTESRWKWAHRSWEEAQVERSGPVHTTAPRRYLLLPRRESKKDQGDLVKDTSGDAGEEKTATTTQAKTFVNEDRYKESCSPNLLFWMSCSTVFPIAPTTCGPAAHTLVVIASTPCGTEETERKEIEGYCCFIAAVNQATGEDVLEMVTS
ncbi:hypothetical protein Anapl_14108 [Anas platyrhynchos]|uniref:Uncharacterized protein n=1 Tax=Anas platyrhynchos TaxID=8839 RepID=R0LC39_ANAPL|nr:hypothetical protein Anapl_14108 [Anas platyrhynchos]